MLRRTLFALLPLGFARAQSPPPFPPNKAPEPDEVRLPNGKLQRDEVIKSDHEKSLQDAAELIKLTEGLQTDLEKAGAFVVPVQTIKKTEDIEKLARRIRGRLKRP